MSISARIAALLVAASLPFAALAQADKAPEAKPADKAAAKPADKAPEKAPEKAQEKPAAK